MRTIKLKVTRLLFIFSIFLLTSCEIFEYYKENKYAVCEENCYEIVIDGIILNKLTNSGIKDIPITLKWEKTQCFTCPEYIIQENKSNSSGEFSFNCLIDTTYFSNEFYLSISIPKYDDYIIFPLNQRYSLFELNEYQNELIEFNFYPKAYLEIELERVENDDFENIIIEHTFKEGYRVVRVISKGPNNEYSSPLNFKYITETASNIITHITWTKKINSNYYVNRDSIICLKDEINYFKIQY
jgi:hypothetical protein